jgi:TniQ/Transcriptional regulator PadR-like family
MSEPRTLAIRVLPQPGESLDSWLEALARRSRTSMSALLDALGLPAFERTHSLLVALSPPLLQRLESQLALPAGRLDQSIISADLFDRGAPHWRFCPQCLRQSQGRWLTDWWLPWTFACTTHSTLLRDLCPRCHKEPRKFLPKPVHLHPPGHCMRRIGGSSRRNSVCGSDLTDVELIPLDPEHPVLQAQRELDLLSLDMHASADIVFSHVDQCLSWLTRSLTPANLQTISRTARDAWERFLNSASSAATAFGAWRLREQERRILTPEFLQREYEEGGRTLREIADSFSLSRTHVVNRAKNLGITIYRGIRPITFDDEWLKEQYVNYVRSAEDIAQEVATCGAVVLRRLEELGVERRPVGIASWTAINRKLNESVPPDIRAAVEGTLHGWLRLRRFQIHMAFPTLQATADYLRFAPGGLTMQFNRLEEAIEAELFHRSVRHSPQRPTSRGASLLQDLDDPQVQQLMHEALGPQIEPLPNREAIRAATAVIDGERGALTSLPADTASSGQIRVPPPLLPLLHHLFANAGQETYAARIHTTTGIPFVTIYKQLKRLEAADWILSRLEDTHERQGTGRRRTYYALTTDAHQFSSRIMQIH